MNIIFKTLKVNSNKFIAFSKSSKIFQVFCIIFKWCALYKIKISLTFILLFEWLLIQAFISDFKLPKHIIPFRIIKKPEIISGYFIILNGITLFTKLWKS